MEEEIEMDTLYMCRICLQSSEDVNEMKSIFQLDDSNMYLYQKIEKCGDIKIAADSNLPTLICRKCNAFLTIAYKFRIICRHSDNYLREFVTQPQKNKKLDAREEVELCPDDVKTEKSPPQNNSPYDEEEEVHDADTIIEEQKDDLTSTQPDAPSPGKTLGITSDGTAIICDKTNKEKNICHICGNSYSKRYALEAHMRRHRNEHPYECEICHTTFHLNFQLIRHMRKHTGAKPYQCQYCKRNFSDRSSQIKHERIHRNERPYICSTCGKSFTYSGVLKVHMLTHSGEKPYNCGICGKRFTCAHHLRAHLETLQHQNDPRSKMLLKRIKPWKKLN